MKENRYSRCGNSVAGSRIRELLKYKPKDAYFFAGGLPAADCLPVQEFRAISEEVFGQDGVTALQYGPTRGYLPLREYLVARMREKGQCGDGDDVIVTSGSQQAIDLVLKLFVDEEDGVIAEDPTFVSSLNSIRNYTTNIYPVEVDGEGADVDRIEELLQAHSNIKLLYLIPTFQNPTGSVMSLERRKRLVGLLEKYDVYLIEDDPYGELRYGGEALPTLKELDSSGRVIFVGSFSKILSPGSRVGWIAAEKALVDKLELLKQGDDVHASMISQVFISTYLKHYDLEEQIRRCRRLYADKSAAMEDAIRTYFPGECTIIPPSGGLFIWCTLPDGMDSDVVLQRALEEKVVFVPGSVFMHDGKKACPSFRLNYSNASVEQIREVMRRLGQTIQQCRQETKG